MEDRRIAKTKAALREGFVTLLKTKPLRDITVAELCRVANVDRRTFYNHYNNVGEIVDEINDIALNILTDAVRGLSIETKEFFDQFTKIFITNLDYYEVMIADRSYYELEYLCRKMLREALIDYYSVHSSVDPIHREYLAEYYASGINSVYIHWIRHGRTLPMEELSQLAYAATKVDWDSIDLNGGMDHDG